MNFVYISLFSAKALIDFLANIVKVYQAGLHPTFRFFKVLNQISDLSSEIHKSL